MAPPPSDPPLVADLRRSENLPGRPAPVTVVTTHGSWVFLTADDVYKVKRPRDLGFLDYSVASERERLCREEVRLNRRTAPAVYLDVLPVRRDAEGHSLVRGGEVVDWAVHMRRLPDDRSALALARAGCLTHGDLDAIVQRLVPFFRAHAIPALPAGTLRANVDENFRQVEPFVGRWLEPAMLERIRRVQHAWLAAHESLLARRACVDGHGDLRLEHVYLLPAGPTIIDCIEFAERFRAGDPLLDLAFLAMDLCRLGHDVASETLLARYALAAGDYDGYPLADGYVSYRAFVRGKVACVVAADPDTADAVRTRKTAEAARLFALAEAALQPRPRPPYLLALGGMIASGKTTLAEALANARGLASVSADATRKDLAGVGHEQRAAAAAYDAGFTARVHDELVRRADCVLRSGRTVIVDTTFAQRALRVRVRELARAHGARFRFVECVVPEAVARERLRARRGGLSDAREAQYETLVRSWEPVAELSRDEHLVLDTTAPLADALRLAGAGLD